jgi:hypothetical protein
MQYQTAGSKEAGLEAKANKMRMTVSRHQTAGHYNIDPKVATNP